MLNVFVHENVNEDGVEFYRNFVCERSRRSRPIAELREPRDFKSLLIGNNGNWPDKSKSG